MIKFYISFLLIFGSYLYGVDKFDTNMDRVKHYDVDGDVQKSFEVMSLELRKFIDSTASQALVEQYKNGKLELSEDEKELIVENSDVDNTDTTTAENTETIQETKEPSFFSRMMEKIGLGSTKKLAKEETISEDVVEEEVVEVETQADTTVEPILETNEVTDEK